MPRATAFDPRPSAGTYVSPSTPSNDGPKVTVTFRRDREAPNDWRADGTMENRRTHCLVKFTGAIVTHEKNGALLVWSRFAPFRMKGNALLWQPNKTRFLSKWDKSSNRPHAVIPTPRSALTTDPTWFAGDYSFNASDSDDHAIVRLNFRRLRGRPAGSLGAWRAEAVMRDGIQNISVTFSGANVAPIQGGGIRVDAQFIGFDIDQQDLTWRPEFNGRLVKLSP